MEDQDIAKGEMMRIGPVKLFSRSVIGAGSPPLLTRYILFRTSAIGVYLHHFTRSDYDRALHDHPWPFVAIILKGGYTEEHDQTIDGGKIQEWRGPGSILLRPAEWRHRVILTNGPSWSLIVVGRRARKWGFWLPEGWCWWRRHNEASNLCEDGIVNTNGED
jgi:hypothetical protein